MVNYAKENPGKLTYGTGGIGATSFMFAELFKKATGIKVVHVPFKGDNPSVTALAGGHVDFSAVSIVGALSQLDAKKVRALAVSGSKRDPQLQDVPTVGEVGYPNATFLAWQAYFVSKGTPQPIVEKLSAAFRKAYDIPSVKESIRKMGFIPEYMTGEELQKKIEREYKIFRELAEEGGFLVK